MIYLLSYDIFDTTYLIETMKRNSKNKGFLREEIIWCEISRAIF